MITGKLANLQESERLQLGIGLGDSSLKSVPIQIHADKALQIAQFFRDLALEVVPVKFPVFTEPNPTPNINQNPIFEPKTWIQEAKFKRRSAYRYWRCRRRPSSGPRGPDMLELPKSLKTKRKNPSFRETTKELLGSKRKGAKEGRRGPTGGWRGCVRRRWHGTRCRGWQVSGPSSGARWSGRRASPSARAAPPLFLIN